ncbi:MAG: polysaccharide deacetylase [Lachnospiraceae bacterium]|nr:polysaccharide deacetylase [Lachnospiraceae bacterium]
MDTSSNSEKEYRQQRKARVQRMKRTLIIVCAILLIVPTVACIFLAVKVGSLQKQIDYLYEAKFGNGSIEAGGEVVRMADSKSDYAIVEEGTKLLEGKISGENNTKPENTGRRKVYLTFDDGPSKYTEDILKILKDNNVKATFFVVGKTDDSLVPLYKKIVDSGNTLGLHSYSHQYSVIYNSLDAFKEDFYKIQNYVKDLTGYKSTLYRFPGGSSNQVSNTDMAEFIRFLNSEKVTYFDWNAANGDATTKQYTVSELVSNVINGLEKEGDTVVLMHDTNTKGTTVEALPILIKKLKAMDVDIVPIDSNTEPVQHIKAETVTN